MHESPRKFFIRKKSRSFRARTRHQQCSAPLQTSLFEQLFAVLDEQPFRIWRICHGEDDVFIDVLLIAFVSSSGIVGKLVTELIGFGPAARIIYGEGNENNAVDVALFTRRECDFRNVRQSHNLRKSGIWINKAAIRCSQREDRRGLIYKKPLWRKSEAAVGSCIAQGFDFEDSKTLVCSRGHGAVWRFIAFAEAERPIGYEGRIVRTLVAASREREQPSGKH